MSWLSIFKKVFEGEQEKKEEVIIKQISLAEIPYTTQEEIKKRQSMLESMKKSSLDKIEKFKLDLEMDIRVLRNVNLKERKENEKLKSTVLDNLKLYIDYLNNLVYDLESAKSLPPIEFLTKSSKSIESFTKNSKSAYEKATILIGDELGRTKETVKSFLNVLSQILKELKEISEKMEITSSLQKAFERYEEIKSNINDIEKNNHQLRDSVERIKEQELENKKEIDNSLQSEEFKHSEEDKKKIDEELKIIEAKIQEIKQKIDLKLLSKYFHTDIKRSSLINRYISNFKEALNYYSNLELVEIVRQSKGIDISSLASLRQRIKELNSFPESDIDKKISLLKREIEKNESEIRSHENEIISNEKKAEKLVERENEIKEELKIQLAKINLSLKE